MCPIRLIKKIFKTTIIKDKSRNKRNNYHGIIPVFDHRRGIEAPTSYVHGGSLEYSIDPISLYNTEIKATTSHIHGGIVEYTINPKDPCNTGIEVEYNDNPTEETMKEFFIELHKFNNTPSESVQSLNLVPLD